MFSLAWCCHVRQHRCYCGRRGTSNLGANHQARRRGGPRVTGRVRRATAGEGRLGRVPPPCLFLPVARRGRPATSAARGAHRLRRGRAAWSVDGGLRNRMRRAGTRFPVRFSCSPRPPRPVRRWAEGRVESVGFRAGARSTPPTFADAPLLGFPDGSFERRWRCGDIS